jgi:hypothetical protein
MRLRQLVSKAAIKFPPGHTVSGRRPKYIIILGGSAVQCSALHCTALQYTALFCIVVQFNALQCTVAPHHDPLSRSAGPGRISLSAHYTALHCTAQHCTALHCTTPHCTALHCTALHYTALHCTALHNTAPHCTALHCTALGSSESEPRHGIQAGKTLTCFILICGYFVRQAICQSITRVICICHVGLQMYP